MATYMLWHFLSKLSMRFLLERTFLISKMASVLSSMPSSWSSYLFLLIRRWMSQFASSSLSPNSSLTFWIASVAMLTNYVCSNMTWIDGQISLIESMILAQSISLVCPSSFCSVKSFSRTLIFSPILRAFHVSSLC